tara:strand:+ start:315 stop:686 length:372 start_codon:yes stop_codon:yes gene_type:complete
MPIERINPEGMLHFASYHHVVKAGNIVYIAGQVGKNEDGTLAGDDITSQTEKIFDNLQRCLSAVGGTLDSLTSINVYLRDKADRDGFFAVKDKYLKDNLPTQTMLVVNSMGERVEIEATAYVD